MFTVCVCVWGGGVTDFHSLSVALIGLLLVTVLISKYI